MSSQSNSNWPQVENSNREKIQIPSSVRIIDTIVVNIFFFSFFFSIYTLLNNNQIRFVTNNHRFIIILIQFLILFFPPFFFYFYFSPAHLNSLSSNTNYVVTLYISYLVLIKEIYTDHDFFRFFQLLIIGIFHSVYQMNTFFLRRSSLTAWTKSLKSTELIKNVDVSALESLICSHPSSKL